MDIQILLIIMMCIIAGILCAYFIINIRNNPDRIFYVEFNNIIKKYNDLLIKVDKLPNTKNKSFIRLESFEDLLKIQHNDKNEIYYIKYLNCVDFFVINTDKICFYSIKNNKKVITPLENYIEISKEKENIQKSILDEIEETTIIKIDSGEVYKVSPISKKKSEKKE